MKEKETKQAHFSLQKKFIFVYAKIIKKKKKSNGLFMPIFKDY